MTHRWMIRGGARLGREPNTIWRRFYVVVRGRWIPVTPYMRHRGLENAEPADISAPGAITFDFSHMSDAERGAAVRAVAEEWAP